MDSKNPKIFIVMGTRPEIIKISPILRELKARKIGHEVIFTDQHYDYNLSKSFFEDLELDEPKFHLNIGTGTQGESVGESGRQRGSHRRQPEGLLPGAEENKDHRLVRATVSPAWLESDPSRYLLLS